MWLLLVLGLAAGSLGASVDRVKRGAYHHDRCVCDKRGYTPWGRGTDAEAFSGRLDGHASRLEHLEQEYKELLEKFETRWKDVQEKAHHLNVVDHWVSDLEGSGCEEQHFQCGGDNKQCIRNILVCDGSTDCDNGNDEASHICRNLAPAGSVFEGHLNKDDDTCTKRKPETFRVIITHVDSNPWFKARPHIQATVLLTFHDDHEEQTDSLHATGYYDYATHSFTLNPPESDQLDFHCEFDNIPGHEDRCVGSIRHQVNHHACVTFTLRKKD